MIVVQSFEAMSCTTSSHLAIFSLLIVQSVVLQQIAVGQLKSPKSLNDHGVNWLRDFVRRGKGSVSKLPFDRIFIGQSDSDTRSTSTMANTFTEIAEANANVVKIGGYFNMTVGDGSKIIPISSALPTRNTKSRELLSATTMSSLTTATLISQLATTKAKAYFRQFGNDTGKAQFDFKRLASLLQQMIDKRKAKKIHISKKSEMKQTGRIKNDSLPEETIRSSFQQNPFSVSDLKPTETVYSRMNSGWRPESSYTISKSSELKDTKKMFEDGNLPERNQTLKRSNRYPHEILASILVTKREKVNDDMVPSETALSTSEMHTSENPMIYIIREGSIVQNSENDYGFVSSITLVTDDGEKILVDTGLSTDINGRTWILQRLSELGAPPPSIGHVVTTHGHPDHSGNSNYFPDAFHYAGRFMHVGTHHYFSRIFEDGVEKLTKNVYLLKTPGHTSDDISVLINNTSFFGTVIVSGDIFIRKEDMKDPTIWKRLAANEVQQEESRRRSLCLADCIIPGHGPLFRITSNMKRALNCLDSY